MIRSQGDQQEHQNVTTSSRATFELRAHASHAWLHADRVPRAGCVCLCVETIVGESPRQTIRAGLEENQIVVVMFDLDSSLSLCLNIYLFYFTLI